MKIKLLKVRLSFPALFKPKAGQDGGEPKYSAAFLLNKVNDAAQIDALRAACAAVAREKWPPKIPSGVKYCVRDGSEKDFAGYGPEVLFITASNAMAVPVVGRSLEPLTPASGKPYAGCYVNASIRLWAQDNQFGKRINAQLQAVQFVADGEAFGDKPVDPNEEFAAIDDEYGSPGAAASQPDPSDPPSERLPF